MNPPSLKQSASDFVALLNSQNIKAKFDQMRNDGRTDQIQSEFNAALYPQSESVPPVLIDSTAAGLIGKISLQGNNTSSNIATEEIPGRIEQSLDRLRLNYATAVDDVSSALSASISDCAIDQNDAVFLPNAAATVLTANSPGNSTKMSSPTPANSPFHAMARPGGE